MEEDKLAVRVYKIVNLSLSENSRCLKNFMNQILKVKWLY